MYSKDHEHGGGGVGGGGFRYIFVHCLAQGKQVNHSRKDCTISKKNQRKKTRLTGCPESVVLGSKNDCADGVCQLYDAHEALAVLVL